MLVVLIKGALGTAAIALVWVAIELLWRRTFKGHEGAQTTGCAGCLVCSRRCGADREESFEEHVAPSRERGASCS